VRLEEGEGASDGVGTRVGAPAAMALAVGSDQLREYCCDSGGFGSAADPVAAWLEA